MNPRSAYLLGSDILTGRALFSGPVGEAVTDDADLAVQDAERAISENEAEERQALVPFEADRPVIQPPSAPKGRVLRSEIEGVSDAKWTDFVLTMKTGSLESVSSANARGMFEMKPRRLADLGLMTNLRKSRSPEGSLVWLGDFAPPLTWEKFKNSPSIQYKAFVDSCKRYVDDLCDRKLPSPDKGLKGVSLSGALGILHRVGPSGLKTWGDGERFGDTVKMFERVNGIF